MELQPRGACLRQITEALAELAEALGYRETAAEIGVSVDTVRRRLRGTQPWSFEEVFDLARRELRDRHRGGVAHAIAEGLSPPDRLPSHPLRVPANLRSMLRLVGRLTTKIAETLDDGRVDPTEAQTLLGLLGELESLTAGLRIDLAALCRSA